MSRPLIGITTSYSADHGRQMLDCHYIDAVSDAGGCPAPIPMTTSLDALRPLLDRLDGLVMTGGPAVSDGLIGNLPDDIGPTPARRHDADMMTWQVMGERGRPVLGICYGMQFMNARLGGTINADLQKHFGAGAHSPLRNDGKPVLHEIEVESGSLLSEAMGARPRVNSFHLQSVVDAAPTLHVTARSADGIVEALEGEEGRLVGVQFHPERMGEDAAGLFRQFVLRAARA